MHGHYGRIAKKVKKVLETGEHSQKSSLEDQMRPSRKPRQTVVPNYVMQRNKARKEHSMLGELCFFV